MNDDPTIQDIALRERIAQVLYKEDVAEPLSEWADVHPVARTSYGRRAARVIETLRDDYAVIPIGSVPDWMEPIVWCDECEDYLLREDHDKWPDSHYDEEHAPDKPLYRFKDES